MTRHITVTMTEAEAQNMVSLAECAADTDTDALAVLVYPSKVAAAYRGIDKVRRAIRQPTQTTKETPT